VTNGAAQAGSAPRSCGSSPAQRELKPGKIAENSNAPSAGVASDHRAHLVWLAEWINSGRGIPTSLITNTQRDALLAAGLVTRERLKKLQIY